MISPASLPCGKHGGCFHMGKARLCPAPCPACPLPAPPRDGVAIWALANWVENHVCVHTCASCTCVWLLCVSQCANGDGPEPACRGRAVPLVAEPAGAGCCGTCCLRAVHMDARHGPRDGGPHGLASQPHDHASSASITHSACATRMPPPRLARTHTCCAAVCG